MESAQFGLVAQPGEHAERAHRRVVQFEEAQREAEGLLLLAHLHPAQPRALQEVAVGRRALHHRQMATSMDSVKMGEFP